MVRTASEPERQPRAVQAQTRVGFAARELEAHVEGRETWRVLEVTCPDDVPAHTKVQELNFGDDFMLRRLDYVTDVLGALLL
jgi:hypothetical protein